MSALNIKRLDSSAPNFFVELDALLAFEESIDAGVESAAADIIAQVRARGDAALAELTLKFDRTAPRSPSTNGFRVPASEIAQALNGLDSAKREALEAAAARIREYHERQRAASWSYTDADGTQLGQQITPLDRVGLYVPGGKAAYPSSVLMNAIPAKVAGVQGRLIRWCWRPLRLRGSMKYTPSAVRRLSPRSPTARPTLRLSTKLSAQAMRMWLRLSAACLAASAST
jgi:histidinol dehydrogenase